MARRAVLDLYPRVFVLQIRQCISVVAIPKTEFPVALSQFHVQAARSMAGFTTHVDLRPSRAVGIRGEIEVLLEIGRVALGAHVVPVLQRPCPVKRVVVGDRFLGVE